MRDVLAAFGAYLEERGRHFEATIIGGAALLVMGVIDRATQDVDCLDPEIPEAIRDAAVQFAKDYVGGGAPLKQDWLNNGPRSLVADLPEGWQDRTVILQQVGGLCIRTLGRSDLLKSKLFAYCDRQQDEGDCVALAPSADELRECLPWLVERDGNLLWPEHVRSSLRGLAKEMGYDLDL